MEIGKDFKKFDLYVLMYACNLSTQKADERIASLKG